MTYDRMVFGMHDLNITQTGAGYGKQYSLSHVGFELDLAGSDSSVDFWFNKMPNTCMRCTGRFGTKSTGNTFFFVTCDSTGQAKKVLCADGMYRVITLAMTHSNWSPTIGKVYGYGSVCYKEGTSGYALGNHIHLEVCEGLVTRKIPNIKNYYNLPNMLDARKVFWVLDGWTTVVNTQGLKFMHCKSVAVEPIDWKEDKEPMYFYADTMPCRIRAKLEFKDGKPVGKILATMPKGSKALITHFTNRHEKDEQGFEWFQVKYETPSGEIIEGYVQGDLGAYLVKRV